MKSVLICATALIVSFVLVKDVYPGDTLAKQSVLDFQSARFKAMVDEDLASLERFLADDMTYAHTTGITESKTEFLSTIASGKIDYLALAPLEVDVRIYGDVAVLTGLARLRGAVGDREVGFTLRFLEVARLAGDAWQLIAWQSVRAPEEGD